MTIEQLRWKTLAAWCRDGAHPVQVGRFQYDNEYVELPNGAGSSGESWRRIYRQYRGGFHFTHMNWMCATCGKTTHHEPRGIQWLST